MEAANPRNREVPVEEAQRKAGVLIEALPYMQSFRHKTVVVKLGGKAMTDPATTARVLTDIVFLEQVGVRPILVHGGGVFISDEMRRRSVEPRFVSGLRVTDEATIEIAEEVVHNVNEKLVATINDGGGRAVGLCDPKSYAVMARKHPPVRVEDGTEVDLGFVGEVASIDADAIQRLCEGNVVPVIPPLARGPDGQSLNVNADVVASRVAGALSAEKLVFLSDIKGVWTQKGEPASVASSLSESQIRELISAGIISGGMLPKVRASLETLHAGVRKIHIIDGRIPHSLLLEIFTDKGIGTEIVHEENAG